MSSVYGTIMQHLGDIEVASSPGKGTLFTIVLPLLGAELAHQEISSQHIISGTGTILLIEDEELLRTFTKNMLEEMGYTLMLGENGREGVRMYWQHMEEIRLVLLDMIMPEMGGRLTENP